MMFRGLNSPATLRTMFLLGLVIVTIAAPLTAAYDMFDKIDIDKIVADDAVLNEYIDCFLEKGPCSTNELKELKKIVPEVITTACEKCTSSEKVIVRKLVNAIYEKKPNKAIEFHKKYDPTGENEPKFAAFLVAKD